MAITKPDLLKIWAENAVAGDVVDPDLADPGKFQEGWVSELPPFQTFNFVQNKFSQAIGHINERGIPEWDANTPYIANRSYVTGSNGTLYKSITTNTGNDPVASPAHWAVFPAATAAATDVLAGLVERATQTEVNDGNDNERFVTPQTLNGKTAETNRAGVVTRATQTEANAGTNVSKYITPETLHNKQGSTSARGVVQLSGAAAADKGTPSPSTTLAATPAAVRSAIDSSLATDIFAGVIELATDAEAQAKSSNSRAITPLNLAALGSTFAVAGLSKFATNPEITGLNNGTSITPAGAKTLIDSLFSEVIFGNNRVVTLPNGYKLAFGFTETVTITGPSTASFSASFASSIGTPIAAIATTNGRGYAFQGSLTSNSYNGTVDGSGFSVTASRVYYLAIGK